MVKTKDEAKEILRGIAEEKDLPGISFAAMYVIKNYQDYDYNGSDRLFLAYCEEILDELTHKIYVSEEDFNAITTHILEDCDEPN